MKLGNLLQLIGMLLVLMVGGTLGYRIIEGWSFNDALYMTVVTLSTVGFSEVHELSPNGRLFTIILIILGVGNMAYILSSLFQFALEIKL
ncbi:MAG: two pore domain potassium channel family protein, partial [Bdellovibrionales bacterium]|nr:two pore domain potassium channel family protein [Bdellovibrionales bacterium]